MKYIQKLISDNSTAVNRGLHPSVNTIPTSASTGTLTRQDNTDSSASENTSTDTTVSGPVLNVSKRNSESNKNETALKFSNISEVKEEENKKENENVQMCADAATSTNLESSNSLVIGSKWRHVTADCLACVRTRPPSSHELREAFFAGNFSRFSFYISCISHEILMKKSITVSKYI